MFRGVSTRRAETRPRRWPDLRKRFVSEQVSSLRCGMARGSSGVWVLAACHRLLQCQTAGRAQAPRHPFASTRRSASIRGMRARSSVRVRCVEKTVDQCQRRARGDDYRAGRALPLDARLRTAKGRAVINTLTPCGNLSALLTGRAFLSPRGGSPAHHRSRMERKAPYSPYGAFSVPTRCRRLCLAVVIDL